MLESAAELTLMMLRGRDVKAGLPAQAALVEGPLQPILQCPGSTSHK